MSECPSSLENLPVVSSLVVQAKSETLPVVQAFIEAHPHADVYGNDGVSKMVVVVEMESDGKLSDFMRTLGDIDGVMTVNMVFHHNDDFADELDGINANGPKIERAKIIN